MEKQVSRSDKLTCPKCGRPVLVRVCPRCSDLDCQGVLIARDNCPVCNGKGVILHCEACEMRERMVRIAKSRQKQSMKHKLVHEETLSHLYGNRFNKYR